MNTNMGQTAATLPSATATTQITCMMAICITCTETMWTNTSSQSTTTIQQTAPQEPTAKVTDMEMAAVMRPYRTATTSIIWLMVGCITHMATTATFMEH